jgi:hypothetical protein
MAGGLHAEIAAANARMAARPSAVGDLLELGFSAECLALITPPRTPRWPAHKRRVRWEHLSALLQYGIPMRDLMRDGEFTWGVVRVAGREMIVTDDPRMRAWLHGPGLFKFPEVAEQ